jgi:hypothetical protein
MVRRALLAIVFVTAMFTTDIAAAQDGGIWATRPHAKRNRQEESVPASALPGLVAGLTVQNSSGKSIGRISKVVTGADGSIRKVIAISPVGNIVTLSPSSLSISGGIVTTTG